MKVGHKNDTNKDEIKKKLTNTTMQKEKTKYKRKTMSQNAQVDEG